MELKAFIYIIGVCLLSTHGAYNGISFDGSQMISMMFNEERGLPATNFDTLRVSFRTRRKQGILMQITDEFHSQYVSLEMNNNGGVKWFLNKGYYQFELNSKTMFENDAGEMMFLDYADGSQYEVTVQRVLGGQNVFITVMSEKSGVSLTTLGYLGQIGHLVDSPSYLYVGNNETERYRGFVGCITDMQIDDVRPLRRITHDSMPSYVDILTAQKGCS